MISIAMLINDFNINGISTVVLNYCRHIDKNKFSITIITGSPADDRNIEECRKIGVNIKILPSRKKKSLSFYVALFKEISKKKYDIVHIHGNSTTITVELFLAMLKGIKIRIAHGHSVSCNNIRVHNIMYPFFKRLCTHGFACSSLAGKWLFKDKKYYIIPNAFDISRFKFNSETRQNVRKKLNIEDKYVIGHVGRFNAPKNHLFLLRLFEVMCKKQQNIVLLLIGDGPDFLTIKSVVDSHPFKERIIMYGETSRTEDIYSAMDVFVFPSKFEGLGIVALEAQISGLPCVVSDVLPREVVIGDNIVFKNLNDSLESWADIILNKLVDFEYDREKYFVNNNNAISKYDISESVKFIENLYSEFYNK